MNEKMIPNTSRLHRLHPPVHGGGGKPTGYERIADSTQSINSSSFTQTSKAAKYNQQIKMTKGDNL
ncbi:MAG: hypothetical protein HXX17_08595 [Geobacteraceae bacterium]|nr:hypothetical protein [Geobacteraceae bacterium]